MPDASTEVARAFVTFCFERRPVAWPLLYDEMCYVAARKLFRGMGYEELREAGIDFTLVGLSGLARLGQELNAQSPRLAGALAS